MFAVNVWLVSVAFVSVSCLRVSSTGSCHWQEGEIGRCVPLQECDQSGLEAALLPKCQHLHWEGVCCKSTQNKTEVFVFDTEKSVYRTYSEDIARNGEMQYSSRELAKERGINTNDNIIFHKTNDNERRERKYSNLNMKHEENNSRNNENKTSKQAENNYKIYYNDNDSKYSQKQSQNHRRSRQLNSRENYERTFENSYAKTNNRRNENNNDRITYDNGNFNRNQGDGRNTNKNSNSYEVGNRQRNNENEHRRTDDTDNSRHTTERQTFTRSPSYNTKLRPIDDRPVVDIGSDHSERGTTRRTVTSRTSASHINGEDRREEDSFVFEDGSTERRGSANRGPVGTRRERVPEVVMGPDDSDATKEEKERSFNIVKKMCERYSSSVTQQISATPLLLTPQSVTISVSKCHLDSTPLIVGGELARLNQFPHMAAVGWPAAQGDGYDWLCGGSLVSEEFVLTAAHCTYQDRDDNVLSGPPRIVHLGSNSLDGSEAQRIHIQRVYRHPGYRNQLNYHDVALLKLTTAAVLSDAVRPACLGIAPQSGERVVAAGWGLTKFGGTTTRELRTVALSMWDESGCQQAFGQSRRLPHGVDQSQLCAGHSEGGKDTCQGDSGGPLQVQSRENQCIAYVIGVTSLGRACGLGQSPAVYTRVSQHISFITQVVWPHL